MNPFIFFVTILCLYLLPGLKSIQTYQIYIVFTLWKYTKILEPGLRFIWPIFQSHQKIDIRKEMDEISKELDGLHLASEVKTSILDKIQELKR